MTWKTEPPLSLDLQLSQLHPNQWIAGVDEVGRGALFGPVVAAALLISDAALAELAIEGVADSKTLSATHREYLAKVICSKSLDCRIGIATVREIDRLNILQASLLAMRRAIMQLAPTPGLCLIDGNQLVPQLPMPQLGLVKGDRRSLRIAAASIVAKVWRDRLIVRLARRYPGYDLVTNKGYGTPKHLAALGQIGVSKQHRRSFSPCKERSNG
jgi:ribonuclease HII